MDKYNDIKQKSQDSEVIKVTKKGIKRMISTSFIAGVVAGCIVATSALYVVKKIDILYGKEEELSKYKEVVAEEKFSVQIGYDYNYKNIAEKILIEPDKYHIALYGVFRNVGWNEGSSINLMNKVIKQTNYIIKEYNLDIPMYNDFDDYLTRLGCVNKDGSVNIFTYMSKMDTIIEAQQDLENLKGRSK